jgi:hypothetical protein
MRGGVLCYMFGAYSETRAIHFESDGGVKVYPQTQTNRNDNSTIVKIEDHGLILLLFVIIGQITASFLVVRIPIQRSAETLPSGTYGTMAGSDAAFTPPIGQNASGKTWHTIAIWTISLMAVTTFCSSNYLVFLKEEDRSDLDMIREKDAGRLEVKLRKWHHNTRRALLRIKASPWHKRGRD